METGIAVFFRENLNTSSNLFHLLKVKLSKYSQSSGRYEVINGYNPLIRWLSKNIASLECLLFEKTRKKKSMVGLKDCDLLQSPNK